MLEITKYLDLKLQNKQQDYTAEPAFLSVVKIALAAKGYHQSIKK